MATRVQLRELALLRLQEAEALFAANFFDGSAYLCGYVVELALKARICALIGVEDYPDNFGDRLKRAFRTHDLNELKLLAGMNEEITPETGQSTKRFIAIGRLHPDGLLREDMNRRELTTIFPRGKFWRL